MERRLRNVQYVEVGGERVVVVSPETWQRVVDLIEDLEDERLLDKAMRDKDQETVEFDEVCRNLGLSPLSYLRSRAGLTQVELARKSGLSQSFIARVEADRRRLSPFSRKKIARALGIPEAKLVF